MAKQSKQINQNGGGDTHTNRDTKKRKITTGLEQIRYKGQ